MNALTADSGTTLFNPSIGEARPAIVYRAINRINGHCYIGVTTRTRDARWKDHLRNAARGKMWPLQRAIRKHGAENFELVTIATYPDIESAKAAEIYYIAQLAPEYNATKGGDGVFGYRHTDSTKTLLAALSKGKKHGRVPAAWVVEKMIAARRNWVRTTPRPPHSDETRQKISAAGKGRVPHNKGKPASPEAIAKRVATCNERDSWPRPMLGRTLSPEAVAKRSATRSLNPPRPWLGKKMTDAQRYRVSLGHSKPLICITDGRRFDRSRDAAEYYGVHISSIQSVCGGRYKAVRGLVFRWDD